MLAQAIGEKLDRSKTKWLVSEGTTPRPVEFLVVDDQPTIDITAINNPQMPIQGTYRGAEHWAGNWSIPASTSGTILASLVTINDTKIVYIYTRNGYSRPWLDEMSQIQPLTFRVNDEPSAKGVTFITESPSRAIESPAARSRQKELEWLSSNTDKLCEYQGHWIALEGDKIVAWGSSEIDVQTQAETKGAKVPLLFRVPSEADKPLIGQSLNGYSGIQ